MATRLKPAVDLDTDLCHAIEAVARDDDGAAAREHLAAVFQSIIVISIRRMML